MEPLQHVPSELVFSPPAVAWARFLAPYRQWIEASIGCPMTDALTAEIEFCFSDLFIQELLGGVPIDLDERSSFAPDLKGWELPPNVSPRIDLAPCRVLDANGAQCEGWRHSWKDTPVLLRFEGLHFPVVAVRIPYISFLGEIRNDWQEWVLINRLEVREALSVLRKVCGVENRRLHVQVWGGGSLRLRDSYNWDSLVLDPASNASVRDDFEGFLKRQSWFARHCLPYRRGYLFHGPPGNGKTSVVRVMAAHPEVTAFAFDFFSRDQDNSTFRYMFEQAASCTPALVVLEDLDRVYDGKTHSEHKKPNVTVDCLLECLDGLAEYDGVIVVATANDPASLDTAMFRRPGRFDRLIPFKPPTQPLRLEYLMKVSGGCLDSGGAAAAAVESDRFSFAQLREAYVTAGQIAFSRGGDVTNQDLIAGIGRVKEECRLAATKVDNSQLGFR